MNVSTSGITYMLLVIPTLFAAAVTAQGLVKASQGDESGKVITGFGIVFIGLIFTAYWFFIR